MKTDIKYVPEKYWKERLNKDFSLSGVGHLGFGLEYNIWLYKARLHVLRELLIKNKIVCKGKKVLDIGVGTGFYIKFWEKLGVEQITGIDITNKSIEELKKKYPDHKFMKGNISDLDYNKIFPNEKYDIITAFDVLFHIVDEEDFKNAIKNIRRFSNKGAIILIMDNFLKEFKSARGHESDRTLSYYKKVLNSYSIEIKKIKPIFYFMNTPIDIERINNKFFVYFIKIMWRINTKIRSIYKKLGLLGKKIDYIWAFILYFLDRIILKYTNIGPGTKLLLAKLKAE